MGQAELQIGFGGVRDGAPHIRLGLGRSTLHHSDSDYRIVDGSEVTLRPAIFAPAGANDILVTGPAHRCRPGAATALELAQLSKPACPAAQSWNLSWLAYSCGSNSKNAGTEVTCTVVMRGGVTVFPKF